jgi:hypothetical protein
MTDDLELIEVMAQAIREVVATNPATAHRGPNGPGPFANPIAMKPARRCGLREHTPLER